MLPRALPGFLDPPAAQVPGQLQDGEREEEEEEKEGGTDSRSPHKRWREREERERERGREREGGREGERERERRTAHNGRWANMDSTLSLSLSSPSLPPFLHYYLPPFPVIPGKKRKKKIKIYRDPKESHLGPPAIP